MIAILGTGLLGAGFARALLQQGQSVHVWNRTADKALALQAHGAKAFAEPAQATLGASRVHVVVSDDDAVDAVLDASALAAGALVCDHTTTSTRGAIARTERFRAAGITYLHAPVFMGPQNALESTGFMLVSGDRAVVQRARPLLTPMTGKLVDLGPRVDAAAAFKLMGNLLLMALTAGCADMLGLAKAMGVPPAEAATLLDAFNLGATLPARLKRMLDAAYDQPSWELGMARKDARLMLDESAQAGIALSVLPAIAAKMDALIAEGHTHADWTVLAKDFL